MPVDWHSCKPGVHPTVNDGIVHRVGHGQPVNGQIELLDVSGRVNGRFVPRNDEVDVIGQPAHGEDGHHHHHHLHHLNATINQNQLVHKNASQLPSD